MDDLEKIALLEDLVRRFEVAVIDMSYHAAKMESAASTMSSAANRMVSAGEMMSSASSRMY
jgi:hypothetical protein